MRGTAEERFWSKVDKDGPLHPVLGTRCWLWTAYRKPNGYGAFRFKDASGVWGMAYAHRVVWDIIGKPLTAGKNSLHRCDNPPCVNYLEHLFVGTQADNLLDAGAKGRMARDVVGEKHPRAKFSTDDIATIRAAFPVPSGKRRRPKRPDLIESLAKQFNTTPGSIHNILTNQTRREG